MSRESLVEKNLIIEGSLDQKEAYDLIKRPPSRARFFKGKIYQEEGNVSAGLARNQTPTRLEKPSSYVEKLSIQFFPNKMKN